MTIVETSNVAIITTDQIIGLLSRAFCAFQLSRKLKIYPAVFFPKHTVATVAQTTLS